MAAKTSKFKFSEGDTVQIASPAVVGEFLAKNIYGVYWADAMWKNVGKKFKIVEKDTFMELPAYVLEDKLRFHLWDERLLVPVKKSRERPQNWAPKNMPLAELQLDWSHLKADVKFKKNVTTVTIRNGNLGRSYVGKSRCSPADKWDQETGIDIACLRAITAYHQDRLKECMS